MRRLRLLVAVLVLSNCALGVFSVFLLRKLDHDYSGLIDQTLPLMSQLRAAGRENTDAYRALVAGLVETDPALCAEAATRARQALSRGRAARIRVAQSPVLRQKPGLLNEMEEAGAGFEAIAENLLPRLSADATPASERIRFELLEKALERSRAANRALQDYVEERSQALSDTISGEVRSRSALVLGVASWPLLMGVLIAVVVVVVLAGMFVMLRRIGADDGP